MDWLTGFSGLSRRRTLAGIVLAVVLLPALTAALVPARSDLSVPTALSVYLLAVVSIAAVGGSVAGIVSAIAAPLLANWFLIPPYHTLRINDGENLVELLAFVTTSAIVSAYVSMSARRELEAKNAWRESSILAALATSTDVDPLASILGLLREVFGFEAVVLRSGESNVAEAGTVPRSRVDPTLRLTVDAVHEIVAWGGSTDGSHKRLLGAFVEQLASAVEQRRLRERALEADTLARADELRTAILRSVSHDLRSPLAGIKASVSSLRQHDVEWGERDREEFLASIESDTDRLTRIVSNLLDLSRLESGALRPAMRRVSFEEVVPVVVHALGETGRRIDVEIPEGCPDAWADPDLLERVVDNLVQNAIKWSPSQSRVLVRATTTGNDARLEVVDHGPGIAEHRRAVVLRPFHRLDDGTAPGGLGLGLAIVDRLVSAMSGHLELGDTPGGGLTVTVNLQRTWTERP